MTEDDGFVAIDDGFTPLVDSSAYKKGASESRKKHSQESAPSWMPFPTAYNAVNSALSEGSHNMYEGLKGIWEGPTMERKAHSASQAVRGLGEAASPALAPALVAAPVPTIIRTLAGLAAQKGIEYGAPMVGVPQGYAELGGDITGLAAASAIPGSMPSLPNGKSVMQGAFTAADIVPAMFRPWETGSKVLGRIGKNYVEGQQVPAPPATATPRPTPSPTWSRPIPETPPPPAPKPGPSPTWARPIPAPPVVKPPKPGVSPTWSRGTSGTTSPAPPPEASPVAESRPALSAENQASVNKVLSEQAKPTDLPGGFPDTPEGINAAIHQFAKNIWGAGAGRVHEPIRQIIQERYGSNRTQAYKDLEKLPDGSMGQKQADGTFKIALEDWEKKDLMRYLLEKSPLRPIEPPPK